jgi:hypothetical protein
MSSSEEHRFRPRKLPTRYLRAATERFAKSEGAVYEDWSSFRKHKRVIDDAIAAQLMSQLGVMPSMNASLAALRQQAEARPFHSKDLPLIRPHSFDLHPGLNVLAPPYDFTAKIAKGSRKPSVQASQDWENSALSPPPWRVRRRTAPPTRSAPRGSA